MKILLIYIVSAFHLATAQLPTQPSFRSDTLERNYIMKTVNSVSLSSWRITNINKTLEIYFKGRGISKTE